MLADVPQLPVAPEGVVAGSFWPSLFADLSASRISLVVASLVVLLIIACRALLPAESRSRVRLSVILVVVWGALFLGRAELLSTNALATYGTLRLTSGLVLAWASVAIGLTFVLDVFMRRRQVPKLVRDLTTGFGFIVVLFVVLSRSGVNLLSIITTSAVLTAVIGLALQDTLGNLMSGIALQLESSLSLGEWVQVGDSIGRVKEIRWRSTVIQTKAGDLVILPNAQITKEKITNFARGGLRHRQQITFDVGYQHPPTLVQQTVLAALHGIDNLAASPPPEVLVHSMADSGVRYLLYYWLVDYSFDVQTDSEVQKRLWYALMRANLEIPYPTRSLFVTELTADRQRDATTRERAERVSVLGKIPFFAPLDEQARGELADRLARKVFASGETILKLGDPGDSLYVLHSGRVSVRVGAPGAPDKEVAVLEAGSFFGEMSLMTGEPRRATVVAKGDAECYVIDKPLFNDVIHNQAALIEEVARLLAERQAALASQQSDGKAASEPGAQQALLGRIKSFFGLR